MLQKLLLLSFSFIFLNSFSQNTSKKYWIELTDKANTTYSTQHPEVYLSARAIERRKKQSIPVSVSDFPVNSNYIKLLQNNGAVVLNKSKWLNALVVELSASANIQSISALPFVKKITPLNNQSAERQQQSKFLIEESASAGSEATSLGNNIGAFNYGLSFNQNNQIGATCMHSMGYTGKGIVMAVIDAGFSNANVLPVFERIRNNNQILGTYDFVANETSVYEDHAHGTAVLSTIAGYLDGYLVGTAPDAKFWLIRTEDAATEYIQEEVFWVMGAEFADSVGADVINSSLGYSLFDDPLTNHTYADMDGNTTIITKAADIAASKGIVVVSSAGNSGGHPWYKITAPADADSIITVGAIDSIGKITNFSGRGLTYDGRIKPDVCAKGSKVTYAANWGGIAFGGGTSFSSPITAGAVACLMQANPNRTSWEIVDMVKKSADRYAAPDSVYGYGVPNFCYANDLFNGIISIEEFESANVYPNPFHNYFQINFYTTKDEPVFIELYDVTGKQIRSKKYNAFAYYQNLFEIDESTGLTAGMYFIKINASDKTIIKKIIKN